MGGRRHFAGVTRNVEIVLAMLLVSAGDEKLNAQRTRQVSHASTSDDGESN